MRNDLDGMNGVENRMVLDAQWPEYGGWEAPNMRLLRGEDKAVQGAAYPVWEEKGVALRQVH